ncbi:Polyketide cyclase / dehydrase and lipid transport [Roseibium alexandrii DFL-11]|uniref:Polyketide cyclase / dehydrase and lipid transport n=1 Tax=Roseibium alexandrii (strain DSM 17067 / NCIMB 14079 / DFL-11) TaxID=244592 RepID=A0A5E8UXM4_ROSAD|nr:Polyketide cyclase / dehydrase and lipid transport [Roseibium alexandrii DFL-11]
MDVFLLLVGLVFGGTVSWAISHHFASQSNEERNNEVTFLVRVPCKIETAWEFISNPGNFHNFLHNRSERFQHEIIRPGVPFKTYTNQSVAYDQFVVDWDPPHRFAWGHLPDRWSYKLDLNERGAETDITLTRAFRKLSWYEVIWFKIIPSAGINADSPPNLTEGTIARLKKSLHEICVSETGFAPHGKEDEAKPYSAPQD